MLTETSAPDRRAPTGRRENRPARGAPPTANVAASAATLIDVANARAAKALDDARVVASFIRDVVAYALRGIGTAPSDEALEIVARATGATGTGRDHASRVVQCARARRRLASGKTLTYRDLAAIVGVSPQYAHRTWGARVKPSDAEAILGLLDARGGP